VSIDETQDKWFSAKLIEDSMKNDEMLLKACIYYINQELTMLSGWWFENE
jgi:hypothetical protein